jgi:hypothetical protein
MFSTKHLISRSLLLASAIALPLAGGAALAQTTTPAPAASATTSAPAATATKTDAAKTEKTKQLGAMKATPGEKKAAHDKARKVAKAGTAKTAPVDTKATSGSGTAAKPATAPVTQ